MQAPGGLGPSNGASVQRRGALVDHRESNGRAPVLDSAAEAEQRTALVQQAPDGGFWSGRKVVRWIQTKCGVGVSEHTALAYMKKLGFTKQVPRPKHPDANEEAQTAFKKGGLRAVFETSFENSRPRKSNSGRKTRGDSA